MDLSWTYTEKTKSKYQKLKKQPRLKGESCIKKTWTPTNYFDSREPIQFSPNGQRFSTEGREVTYLDWKFDFLVHTSSGPALFDVRFKEQRVAYELNLQEAALFYTK